MSSQAGQFGPNEWLVEEMYQRFLDDPTAVDPAWHDFFADYRPDGARRRPATRRATARHRRAAPSSRPGDAGDAPRRQARPTAAPTATTRPAGERGAPVAAPARPCRRSPRAAAASKAARPAPAVEERTTTPLRGAAAGRQEHDGLAGGADRDVGARGPGEADGRQPRS